jgi:hypothetical protein
MPAAHICGAKSKFFQVKGYPMKKFAVLLMLLSVSLFSFALIGCGEAEDTTGTGGTDISTPEGSGETPEGDTTAEEGGDETAAPEGETPAEEGGDETASPEGEAPAEEAPTP